MKSQFIEVKLAGKKTIQIKNINQQYLDSPFHFHHLCELVWIEKGYGKRIVGDHVDNFEEADLVLMGPNLPHIWQNDEAFFEEDNKLSVHSTVIYFPPDFLINLTDEQQIVAPIQDLVKRSDRGIVFSGKTKKQVTDIIVKIPQETGLGKIIHFLEIIEILSHSKEFEYLASISFKNIYDEADADRIHKVYQHLMQNFHRDIDLQEISDLIHMTPNAFCRFFKSRTQKTFTQFLNELRIGHATRLLQNENLSVADVCYKCGYNNLVNFNRFFKSIHHITPTEYRKKVGI